MTAIKNSKMMQNRNYTIYNHRFTTNTKAHIVAKTILEILEILLWNKMHQHYHLYLQLTQKTEFGVYRFFQIKSKPRCLS